MKRILLVKLTSLGDLIHALPALTDAKAVYPGLKIDWVIDENFREVASWHSAVGRVFTTNHRHWRKGFWSALAPIGKLIREIRKTKYDLVIDGQGNFKTALLGLFVRGPTAGFDRKSVREPVASFAYQKKYAASKKAHAIDRLRQLFAQCLNYPVPTSSPDFGIDTSQFGPSVDAAQPYFFFVHNASWKTKQWPEEHGKKLIQLLVSEGYRVLLPWGSEEERARAERMAAGCDEAMVLPKLTLSQIGRLILDAKGCVCMDTGLSHLAAALHVPSVTLYGSTDSGLIGACGQNQSHLSSTLACSPCHKKVCQFGKTPLCLAQITPEAVFQRVLSICNKLYVHCTEK
jgi:heptosyltransferase-1